MQKSSRSHQKSKIIIKEKDREKIRLLSSSRLWHFSYNWITAELLVYVLIQFFAFMNNTNASKKFKMEPISYIIQASKLN